MYTFVIVHDTQEDDSFSFVRYVAHHGHVIFESKFRAISLLFWMAALLWEFLACFYKDCQQLLSPPRAAFQPTGCS